MTLKPHTIKFDDVPCRESPCEWPECVCPRKPHLHSTEAVTYAFTKATEVLAEAGYPEVARILASFQPTRTLRD